MCYTVFITHIREEFEAMTHNREDVRRIAELNSTFMTLNDKGKDSALTILRALSFAQAVMGADTCEEARNAAHQQPARAG